MLSGLHDIESYLENGAQNNCDADKENVHKNDLDKDNSCNTVSILNLYTHLPLRSGYVQSLITGVLVKWKKLASLSLKQIQLKSYTRV